MGVGERVRLGLPERVSPAARVHQMVIVGLAFAVLVSLGLRQPEGSQRGLALVLVGMAILIALSLGGRRIWPRWRAVGGVLAAGILAVLFAATGGADTVYQDTVIAVMVVSALTLSLRLLLVNTLAATLAALSPWLYDPAADATFLTDLTADLGVWLAVTVGVYLQTLLLRSQARRLEESDQLRVSFLRATSHELRTPLTSVVGFADTLERMGEELGAEQRRALTAKLAINAGRLRDLVEDLLDVDRLTSGLVQAVRTPHDVTGLVERVVEHVDRGDCDVRLELDAVTGSIDVPKIERVVFNLVTNAVRHTGSGGSVTVELVADGRGIVLTVVDEGPGISEGYENRIFEPFIQGPERATSSQPGTGLGLTLVREFVTLHGGRVSARNRPTGGACFEVVLPADPSLDRSPVPVMP